MAGEYAVAVQGLDALSFTSDLAPHIVQAASRAINDTADHARTAADRAIRLQVAFSASYLAPSAGRLAVTKRASADSLAAVITGRARPTSLSRFVTGQSPAGGVSVAVKPGVTRFMRRAFLLRLPQGAKPVDDTTFNLGLAIRLKPGERVRNKREMVALGRGLYLLFGPSVDQVFATVSEEIAPAEAQHLEDEFSRLVALDD